MQLKKVFFGFRWIMFILMLTVAFGTRLTFSQEKVYVVVVVPQFTPVEIHERWEPFLKELSRRTGLNFSVKTYQSIPNFEEAFHLGEPDFAFMNPYHQVMAHKAQGYIPLVKDETLLTGILVVKKDSPVQRVEDLNGATIAFPAPNAFGASLYMRALLAEKFKIKFEPLYVKTHDNVYRHVILGMAQAGGGVNNTLLRQPAEVRRELRILYETPGSAPHPLSAHPRVPQEVREMVKRAILEMTKDPAMKGLLNAVQMPKPVSANYERDYKPLENLRLEKYVVKP